MPKSLRSLNTEDFHKMYRIRCMEKGITPKEWPKYRKIIVAMGNAMSDILLEDGIVGMPWHVGDLLLKQHRNVSEEFWITNEFKQAIKVKEFNDHSDGIKYKSFWLSIERQQKKRLGWCFSLFHPTRHRLSQLIKGGKSYPDWQILNLRTKMRGDKRKHG